MLVNSIGVKRALVVGGGIAGLAIANGLADLGIEVDVVERGGGETRGAGLGFLGNALVALGQLGLRDQIIAAGYISEHVNLCEADGRVVRSLTNPWVGGIPSSVLVARVVLARILTEEARSKGVTIHYHSQVRRISDGAESCDVAFATEAGETTEGRYDLVVGSDGAYSQIRSDYFRSEVTPKPLNVGNWRALLRQTDLLPHGHAIQGRDCLVYMYPAGSGYVYAGVSTHGGDGKRYSDAEGRAQLKSVLAEFTSPQVRYFHDSVDTAEEVTFRLTTCHLLPMPWHRGRVVLIGDAAHTMPANLSGGGGMAVEDAAVLVSMLRAGGPVADTLQAFSERRFARVKRVLDASMAVRANGTNINVWGNSTSIYKETLEFLMQPA